MDLENDQDLRKITQATARLKSLKPPAPPAEMFMLWPFSEAPRDMPREWVKDFPIVTEEEIRAKAAQHDDCNSFHRDDIAARAHGKLGIFACKMHIDGYVASAVSEKIDCVTAVKEGIGYLAPLYAGSYPRVHCRIRKAVQGAVVIDAEVKNGTEVIARGTFFLKLPQ